jgi:hypothetical protein
MKRIISIMVLILSMTLGNHTFAQQVKEIIPVGATLTAPLEVGGGGVKPLTLYFLDKSYRAFLPFGNYSTVDIKISGDIEKGDGNITDQNISKTATIILQMYKQVLRDYFKKGLSPSNVVVYTSSGVGRAKNIKVLTEAIKAKLTDISNFTDMADVLKPEDCLYKRKVYVVGEDEEAKYTIAGSIPFEKIEDALSLDQGGSNGKGGYVVASDGKYIGVPMVYDLGSTRIAERVRQLVKGNPSDEYVYLQSYIRTCDSLFDNGLATDIFSVFGNIDGAAFKKELYLTGGYAFILSSLLYPDAPLDEKLVRLRYDDIKHFVSDVRDTAYYNAMLVKDVSKLDPQQQKNYKKALSIYNQLQLIAASKLFLTYVDAVEAKKKSIYFNRHGLHAMPSVLMGRYLRKDLKLTE